MGLDPAVDEVVVLGAEPLRDDVVDVEAQPAGIGAEGDDGLADREVLEVGHAGLDHEPPPAPEVGGGAIRPVPIPSSSAAPRPARPASRSMTGVTTAGSNMAAACSSYTDATRSPKNPSSWPWSAGIRTSG